MKNLEQHEDKYIHIPWRGLLWLLPLGLLVVIGVIGVFVILPFTASEHTITITQEQSGYIAVIFVGLTLIPVVLPIGYIRNRIRQTCEALFFNLFWGLFIGLFLGLFFSLLSSSPGILLVSLFIGLLAGLSSGLFTGLVTAIGSVQTDEEFYKKK